MKRLIVLILTLNLSLTAFSQTGTSNEPVKCFPIPVVKQITKDLLSGDSAKAQLKLTEQQLAEMVSDFDVIIAGTEPITDYVMEKAKNLKMISRVGIGLDSVDLLAAERRGIRQSGTLQVQRSKEASFDAVDHS